MNQNQNSYPFPFPPGQGPAPQGAPQAPQGYPQAAPQGYPQQMGYPPPGQGYPSAQPGYGQGPAAAPPQGYQQAPAFAPGQLDAVLSDIESTEPLNERMQRLGVGQHTVLLTKFYGRNSAQGYGTILYAEFIVEKSTLHIPGERRNWMFFPGLPSWAGKHEKTRVIEFMATVDACVGQPPRGTKITGGELANGKLRGLRIEVVVTPAIDKKTGHQRTNNKGEPINNAAWTPVRQTEQEIAAQAANLPPDRQAAPVQAPQYAPPAQQYGGQNAPWPGAQTAPQAPALAPYPGTQAPLPQYQGGQGPAPYPGTAPAPQGGAPAPGGPSIIQGLRGGAGGQGHGQGGQSQGGY